jgi:hypothetical protein
VPINNSSKSLFIYLFIFSFFLDRLRLEASSLKYTFKLRVHWKGYILSFYFCIIHMVLEGGFFYIS